MAGKRRFEPPDRQIQSSLEAEINKEQTDRLGSQMPAYHA
jgi:hypothetical protein